MAGFLSTLFGGGAERDAANKNRSLYQQYGQAGTGFLDAGMTGSRDALATAKGEFAPLSALYGRGSGLYADSLGVNGASGNANAQAAYTSSPGYQWQLGQGLDAINRRRAVGGMANSGNADLEALTYGQGLAKQDYGNWQNQLGGYDQKALTTAGGMAGIDTGLANLYQSDSANRIGLQGNVTSGNANANQLQAQGEAGGARNLLGGIMGGASLLMGSGGLSGLMGGPNRQSTMGYNPLGGAFNFGR